MTDRFKIAAEAADLSFWAVIAEHYPEAKHGDFPPDATIKWDNAKEEAIITWVTGNINTFKVNSSHGEIIADKLTGKCLIYDCDDDLRNIIRFDVHENCECNNIEQVEDEVDILDFGYWYLKSDGTKAYEKPAYDWREERKYLKLNT